MAKQPKFRLRLTVLCNNREQVINLASAVMNRVSSHLTVIGMGKKLLSVNIRPLDEQYFDHQESLQVVGRTIAEIVPKDIKWTLTLWHKQPKQGGSK